MPTLSPHPSHSDVVVQIVDARNPLLFRCEDLVSAHCQNCCHSYHRLPPPQEKYVCEVDPRKANMLLISKADLLTQKQRYLL